MSSKRALWALPILLIAGAIQAEDAITLREDRIEKSVQGGKFMDVRWESSQEDEHKVDVMLSGDDGETWVVSAVDIPVGVGRFTLPIPALNSNRCLIRVILKDSQGKEVGRSQTRNSFMVDSKAPAASLQVPASVASRQAPLAYAVEEDPSASGLDQVRLFHRIKGGQSWEAMDDDKDLASPYQASFPRRGTYDLYLFVKDAVGNSNGLPGPETAAMATVEVTSGEPIVRLKPMPRSQVFGKGSKFDIQWEATDDDLHEGSVTLQYKDRAGLMKVIAEKIPNTGTFTWNLPDQSFEATQIRITVTDAAGNTSTDSRHMSVIVDVVAPSCSFTGPILIKEKVGLPRLAQRIRDEGGSGVTSLRMYSRQAGETSWVETPLKLSSVYEKVPFDRKDGIWEVILCGTDAAGNSEEAPGPDMAPELSLLLDRHEPELIVTDLREENGILIVSWKSKDANLGNLPVRLSWTGQAEILRNLPPEGEHRITITREILDVTVTVIDLAGHTKQVRSSWTKMGGTQPARPDITILSKGAVVGPGALTLLFDASKFNGPFEARLLRQGQEVLRKTLGTESSRIEWEPKGAHGDEFQWEFMAGDRKILSEEWTLDTQAPEARISAPGSVTEGEFEVSVDIVDGPGSIAEALLWTRENDKDPWNSLKLLPTTSQKVKLSAKPGRLALRVSAKDTLGNALEPPAPDSMEGTVVVVTPKIIEPEPTPIIEVPILAFEPGDVGQEQAIGRGLRVMKFKSARISGAVKALLFENGQEILSKELAPGQTEISWEPMGAHDSIYQWRLYAGSLSPRSRPWRLDARAPDVRVMAPDVAQPGNISVTIMASDRAGVSTLSLWYRQKGAWVRQELDPAKPEQIVDVSATDGNLEIALEASDKLGNILPSPEKGGAVLARVMVGAKPQEPLLAFLDEADGKFIAAGSKQTLRWKSEGLEGESVLESLDEAGQWVKRLTLPAEARQAQIEAPAVNHSNWKWRIRHGGLEATMREGWKVDATAPAPLLAAAKPTVVLPEKIALTLGVKDEGPAGHGPVKAFVRRRGEKDWKPLGSVDEKGGIEFQGDPGAWEFTASVTDILGRGVPEPGAETVAMLVVEVFEKSEANLVLTLAMPGDLVRGGEKFPLKVEGQDLPAGRIHIRDEKGAVVGVLEESGQIMVEAPKKSLEAWVLTASISDSLFSQSLKIRVDAENPVGRLVLDKVPEGLAPARVRVEAEDRGPAGVESVEIVESRDGGRTWVRVESKDGFLDVARGDDPVWLAVRVLDRAGFWSRAVPDAATPDLVVAWPGQEGPGFLTFADAGVYKGGSEAEIKWRGLMKDGELQYLAGPEMPWIPVANVKAGQRAVQWKLPRDTTRSALLRIVAEGGVELFRSPTSFAIDSTPKKSMLAFIASDVIEEEVVYSRQRAIPEPRHPKRTVEAPEVPESVGAAKREGSQRPAPEEIPGVDAVEPYDFVTLMSAARDSMVRGDFGKASTHLESAIRQNSSDAESHWMLAQCYQKMHRKESMVVDALHKSLDLNARNPKAWNHLGVLAKLRDDRVLARSYFLKAIDIEDLPETHLNMAILHYEDGEMVQARDGFNKVRDLLRADMTLDAYKEATWRLTMIYSYSTLKDEDVARRMWAQVLELFGRDSFQGKRARHWLEEVKAR